MKEVQQAWDGLGDVAKWVVPIGGGLWAADNAEGLWHGAESGFHKLLPFMPELGVLAAGIVVFRWGKGALDHLGK